MFGRPLPLRPDTSLWADEVNATDEDILIGLLVGNGKITQSMLDKVTPDHYIHGTSATTLTADTWTLCPMVWIKRQIRVYMQ